MNRELSEIINYIGNFIADGSNLYFDKTTTNPFLLTNIDIVNLNKTVNRAISTLLKEKIVESNISIP